MASPLVPCLCCTPIRPTHNGTRSEGERVTIRAVLFDFGGVLSTSPFDAFAQLEAERGLPPGFIRRVNATNPDDNAWARLERSEIDLGTFAAAWSAEAHAVGHDLEWRFAAEGLAADTGPLL